MCGSEEHGAWSFKCPKRPTKPLEGIPNIQVKPLNKKSKDIDQTTTKKSRIHSNITIHDLIIDTYIRKLNKDAAVSRETIISKLRSRFITEYQVDTTAVWSGNRIYILMFDLENPLKESPTNPIEGINNAQYNG